MKKLFLIGLSILFLGIGMFIFGVSMFTYQGNALNPLMSEVGKYCFVLFGPVGFIGLIVIIVALSNRKKSR